jgi:hypothetical protein
MQVVMSDPVLLVGDGQTYEREAITRWLADHDTSPSTGVTLTAEQQILAPNYLAKSTVDKHMAR